MDKVRLYNTRKVGGPSITIPIPGHNDVSIPAEGDPDGDSNALVKDAKGVEVEADAARLQKQAKLIRGLKVEKI